MGTRNLLFTLLIAFSQTTWAGGLLSITPSSEFPVFGLFRSNSSCRNNKRPSLAKLNQLKAQGHKIALLTTGGASIATPRYQLKDVFQGRLYLESHSILDAMEDYVRARGVNGRDQVRDEVRNCVTGNHHRNSILTESCVQPFGTIFAHLGIVVFESDVHDEPYVIHFYSHPDTGWLAPAIRVETADSYLAENTNLTCETEIILPTRSAQQKIHSALTTQLPNNMLSPSRTGYNFISHPWGLKTQNCNEWLSSFLAVTLLHPWQEWETTTREQARQTLINTRMTPTKIVLRNGQSLMGVLAGIPGFNAYEGNINHNYGVGDGLLARSVLNWMERNGWIRQRMMVRGQMAD